MLYTCVLSERKELSCCTPVIESQHSTDDVTIMLREAVPTDASPDTVMFDLNTTFRRQATSDKSNLRVIFNKSTYDRKYLLNNYSYILMILIQTLRIRNKINFRESFLRFC